MVIPCDGCKRFSCHPLLRDPNKGEQPKGSSTSQYTSFSTSLVLQRPVWHTPLSSGLHPVFFCCCQPPKPVACKKGLSCTLKILPHNFSVFASLNHNLYELAQVSKATEFQGCIWLGHWQVSKATEFQRKHHIILYCGCSLIQLELEMGIVMILKPRKNTCLAISTSTSTLWRMHNSRIEKMVHGSTFPVMTWLVWQHNSR